MYQRYQAKWIEYMEETRLVDMTNKDEVDKALLGFFINQSAIYAPSTLYVIYSCVNSWFIMNHGFRINSCLRVNKFLKQATSRYVGKKSKVLNADEVDILLKFCQKSQYHEDTLMGVCLALQYYGLLRNSDVIKIAVENVKINKEGRVEVRFEHKRKRKNPGFTFYIPVMYAPLFEKYISELETIDKKSRFLKNFLMLDLKRTQNTGYKKVSNFIKKACAILGLDPKGYTGHCMRRSAATNLADNGVSFVNLKRHGQWKSDSVVEGYIANSEPIRLERLQNLMPKPREERIELTRRVYNPYQKVKLLTQELPSSSDDDSCNSMLNSGPVFETKSQNKCKPVKGQWKNKSYKSYESPKRKSEKRKSTNLVSPDMKTVGQANSKKFKRGTEFNATDALLSMNSDRVSYLQEVLQNEDNTDTWKPNAMKAEDNRNENNLPFMSQLTTNSTGSSVTLRDEQRNETERTETEENERTRQDSLKSEMLPDTMKEILKHLDGGTIFTGCTFNLSFVK